MLLSLCLTLAAVQAPAEPETHDIFAPPKSDLVIKIGQGSDALPSMMALLDDYALLTDQTVIANNETRALMQAQNIGITQSLTVPREEVQSFVEQLLVEADFIMQPLRDRAPRAVGVYSLRTNARTTVRSKAHFVAPSELEHFKNHPALLITTTVHLPNTDVRQLSNSLRTMITDANVQQMIPAGKSGAVVITGLGASVVELVRTLETVDDASATQRRETEVAVIALEFADAKEILLTLRTIFAPPSRFVNQGDELVRVREDLPTIVYDERTNSVIAVAYSDDIERIQRTVQVLDVER